MLPGGGNYGWGNARGGVIGHEVVDEWMERGVDALPQAGHGEQ